MSAGNPGYSPEDTVRPREDIVRPPEDTVRPPEDAVGPPEDAWRPPADTYPDESFRAVGNPQGAPWAEEHSEDLVPERPPVPTMTQPQPTNEGKHPDMSQIDQAITDLLAIDGATGAAIVDIGSGMALATGGNPSFNLEVAAAGNSNVVRAKLNTMSDLGISEAIHDILITLDDQYHLINVLSTDATKGLFLYLVLNKRNANLALARHKLGVIASSVQV